MTALEDTCTCGHGAYWHARHAVTGDRLECLRARCDCRGFVFERVSAVVDSAERWRDDKVRELIEEAVAQVAAEHGFEVQFFPGAELVDDNPTLAAITFKAIEQLAIMSRNAPATGFTVHAFRNAHVEAMRLLAELQAAGVEEAR